MFLRRGVFSSHISDSQSLINESLERTRCFSDGAIRSASGIPVFISHKHSDLPELKGLLGFLKNKCNVVPYIDSMDKGMPPKTCATTASRIKKVIEFCPKFIFLATEDALTSMWCNWEVGIADKWKLSGNNMAIMPILDPGKKDEDYKGQEYLRLYPYIEDKPNSNGVGKYLVVNYPTPSGWKQTSFKNWLNNILCD